MKNITWRKIALIISVILVGAVAFGIGYGLGAVDSAKFMIDKAVKIMQYEGINIDITRAELLQYYIKLKGGI